MNPKALNNKTKAQTISSNNIRVEKRLWQDFERIFPMPHWPPWFMELEVLIMVKAGV